MKMICRLCLKDSIDYIDMFTNSANINANIAAIIAKYFWFEPTAEDPISKMVCQSCWSRVWDFHEFYLLVEEANRQYMLLEHKIEVKKEEDVENMLEQMPVHVRLMEHIDLNNEEIKSCNILAEELIDNPMDVNDSLSNANEEFTMQSDLNTMDNSILAENLIIDPMDLNDESQESNDEACKLENISISSATVKEKKQKKQQSKRKTKRTSDEDNMPLAKLKPKIYGKKTRKRKKLESDEEAKSEDELDTEDLEASSYSKDTSINTSQDKEENMNDKGMRRIDQIIAQHTNIHCNECGIKVETFAYLCKHMKKKHQIEKGYVLCCDRKFISRRSIFAHAQTAINPESYKCEICGKRLYNSFNLRKHMLTKHQPEEAKNFECKHCPKRFATGYLLKKHAITHDERSHICDICQKGFQSAGILTQHKKITHEGYGIMCDICAKVFPGRVVFEKHQLVHRDVPLKLQCNICFSWHKGPDSLRMHKSMHNQEGQIHMCSHCGKMSPNRVAMLKHIRDVHTSERKYQCTYCEKAFKRAIHLKEHLSSHTGEALYSCPHCSRKFNSNSNMHSHRKKMHPVEFEETRRQQLEMRKMPPPNYEASTAT